MADAASTQLWIGRGAYLGCAALLVFISLIPFNFESSLNLAPDLLFALSFAILLRRPEFAPFWILLLVFLLSGILQMRPLGLWTAIVLVAAEFSRPQEYRFRELPLPFEWAFVGGLFFVSLLVYRMVLSLAVVPQVKFSATMVHFFVTVLAYPLVILFCHYVLRVRKITPGEATRLGHRL